MFFGIENKLKINELYFAEKEWIDGQWKDREITLDFMGRFGFVPTEKDGDDLWIYSDRKSVV